jgi:phosphoribosylanthranilate isomerase
MTQPKTYVKICGITTLEDALGAAEAGADMLGFIFYPPSPRAIAPSEVGAIAEATRRTMSGNTPRFVGVFVDAPAAEVRRTMAKAHLDLAQLHGRESPEFVAQFGRRALKAIRPQTLAEAQAALADYEPTFTQPPERPNLLADAYHPASHGGTGQRIDVEVARALARRCRLMLAGGLTPENIQAAIEVVAPWGVDVSSGVEVRPGEKDHTRVRAFVQAVRALETKA